MPKMIGITGFERTTSSTSKRAENLNEATAINRTLHINNKKEITALLPTRAVKSLSV